MFTIFIELGQNLFACRNLPPRNSKSWKYKYNRLETLFLFSLPLWLINWPEPQNDQSSPDRCINLLQKFCLCWFHCFFSLAIAFFFCFLNDKNIKKKQNFQKYQLKDPKSLLIVFFSLFKIFFLYFARNVNLKYGPSFKNFKHSYST